MLYGYNRKTGKAQRFGFEWLSGCYRWYDGDSFINLNDNEIIISILVNHSRNKNDIITALKFIDTKHKNHNEIEYNVEIIDNI